MSSAALVLDSPDSAVRRHAPPERPRLAVYRPPDLSEASFSSHPELREFALTQLNDPFHGKIRVAFQEPSEVFCGAPAVSYRVMTPRAYDNLMGRLSACAAVIMEDVDTAMREAAVSSFQVLFRGAARAPDIGKFLEDSPLAKFKKFQAADV